MIDVTVVVMAKAPRPGRVKTRLCPPCSPAEAARIAQAALVETLSAVTRSSARIGMLALDGPPGPWLPLGFPVVPQSGGGLGDRLTAALARIDGPALALGMDTPQVIPSLLDDACRRLLDPGVDAVLGAAVDGGYWAIGLRGPCPDAFTGVPMSTAATGARQRDRLRALGLSVADLPTLRDVDTFADAVAVARAIPDSRFARALEPVAARLDRRRSAEAAA